MTNWKPPPDRGKEAAADLDQRPDSAAQALTTTTEKSAAILTRPRRSRSFRFMTRAYHRAVSRGLRRAARRWLAREVHRPSGRDRMSIRTPAHVHARLSAAPGLTPFPEHEHVHQPTYEQETH